jgi:hypothetical protein
MRIGLPLAAWLAALGRPSAAVVAYQILCWLGAAAGVFLLARWLSSSGGSAWWALTAALGAGILTSVVRCTPDAAATALVLAALIAHRRGRLTLTVALAAAAVLVRETSWLAAAAVAISESTRGGWRRAAAAAVLPLAPLAAWSAWTSRTVDGLPISGRGNFAVPFAWVAAKAGQLGEQLSPNPVEVVGVAAIVAMLLSPIALLRPCRVSDSAVVTYLLFAGLAWSLGWAVWSDAHAFSRVLLPLALLAPVLAADRAGRFQRALLLAVPVSLLAVGCTMTWITGSSAPLPRPAAAAGSADLPQQEGETFIVLGAARTRGASGEMWRTDLELSNPLPASVTVTVEALPTDRSKRPHRPGLVRLRPHEVRVEENVLESLVPFYGVVGMRVATDRRGVAIRWATHLESEAPSHRRWNRALPIERAFESGERALLAGLEHDPEMGTRTDLAVLNVSDQRIELHIDMTTAGGQRAAVREFLEPWQFVQLHGILDGIEPAAGSGATATVWTSTDGGTFLVRATVVRPGAETLQVEAERAGQAASGRP